MRSLSEPVVASEAIADVLVGPSRPAEVIHRSGPAVYLRLRDGRIIVAETAGGIGLPISMTVQEQSDGDVGTTVAVGGRAPARWWSPRAPRIIPDPVRLRLLDERLSDLPSSPDLLEVPLHDLDPAVDPAALVGLGPGLTPAGDDLLAGMLVTLHALGRCRTAASIADRIDLDRTTPISAALLAQATSGRAARPLLELLRSLTGASSTGDALDGLLAVGATSGRWLATGALGALRQL